jgi:hypothetical protein
MMYDSEGKQKKNLVKLICSVCGTEFERKASQYNNSLYSPHYTTHQVFCSRWCFSHYVGKKNKKVEESHGA